MKVRILTSITAAWGAPAPGDVLDLPDSDAADLVAVGYAEPVKPARKPAPTSGA